MDLKTTIIRRLKSKNLIKVLLFLIIFQLFYLMIITRIDNNNRLNIHELLINNIKSNASLCRLYQIITDKNEELFIRNRHYFKNSSELPDNLVVLLVQVHSRIGYLNVFLDSLQSVRYIENTLVIFSHDYYDEEINRLIESIKFCPILQIFYPYMLQLYPNSFPGRSETDCPVRINKTDAIARKCSNINNPDLYGNYRDYKKAQIKHHWFWKISFVFDRLELTKSLKNMNVVLLEEDFYLLPDTLHMFRKLNEFVRDEDRDIVSLGVYEIEGAYKNYHESFLNKYGNYKKHFCTPGLVARRSLWNHIKKHYSQFCTLDEYNWDWTVRYILKNNSHEISFNNYFPQGSRILHVGACGSHYTGNETICNPSVRQLKFKEKIQKSIQYLFPKTLELHDNEKRIKDKGYKQYGGWSDKRDQDLCKSFIES